MICYYCLKPTEDRFCHDCSRQLIPSFQLMDSLPNICLGGYFYGYSDTVRYCLHEIKFRFNDGLARLFRNFLHYQTIPNIFLDSDAIVYVKSHWFRQFLRGPSHINFLFDPVLDQLSNFYPHYLVRESFSRGSYHLNRHQRELAIIQPRFSWQGPSNIKSVTVIDDICTTGSTLIDIARLLKSYGIDNVKVLVISYVKTTTTLKSKFES